MNVLSQIHDQIQNNNIEDAYRLIIGNENAYKDNPTFWTLKAMICIKAEHYQVAYNCLHTAKELDPVNPDIYYNMAYVCECMQNFSEAALLYGKAARYTDDQQLKQEIDQLYSLNKEFTYIKNIAKMHKKRTYIILSSCGWREVLQRMHHIARALVKFDNNVLFVSPPVMVDVNMKNLSIQDSLNYVEENKRVVDGVEIYQPLLVRFEGKPLLNNYDDVVQMLLENQLDAFETIFITYLPGQVNTIEKLRGSYKIIYECVDDHSDLEYAFWGDKKDIVLEQELMNQSHAITTTATSLFLQRASIEERTNVYLSRNAVNESDFMMIDEADIPGDLKHIPEPRIVYTGAIYQWFDVDLFYSVVKSNPDKSFVIIGFGQEELLKEKCDNLYFLGVKKHQELKKYLRHMQVGIIPFKDNIDIIFNCDPIKQYEYLACGLPVVTTYMPDTAIDKIYTFHAGTPNTFSTALDNALKLRVDVEKTSQFVLKNSWNARAALLCELSGELIEDSNKFESRLESIESLLSLTADQIKHPNLELLQAMLWKKCGEAFFLSNIRRIFEQSQAKFIARQLLRALIVNDKQEEFLDVIKRFDLTDRFLLFEMLHRKEKQDEGALKILEFFCVKEYSRVKKLLNRMRLSDDKRLFSAMYHYCLGEYKKAFDELNNISEATIENSPMASYILADLMKRGEKEDEYLRYKKIYGTYEYKFQEKVISKTGSFDGPYINVNDEPFISIVVPTRNSADVVKYALQTCIAQSYNNFEIIVSDNSSPGNDHTKKVVEELSSKKIRYYRTPEEYAMIENYEFAYEKANGEYVMIIGSDDGLLLHALSTISEIIKHSKRPLSLSWDVVAYGWPKVAINNIRNGLFIPYPTQRRNIQLAYYDESILKSVLNFEKRYSLLPMFYYNSIIKRELAEEVRRTAGKVFMASPPDVYTGIVFSYFQKSYLHVQMPMTIGGSSENSMGINASYSLYKPQNKNDDVSFEVQKMRSLNNDYHSVHAPYFVGEESAVVAASYMAKKIFGNNSLNLDVNREKFYEICTNHLFADDGLEMKKMELYDCIKSYGDPSIIRWYEKEFFYNEKFKGYANPHISSFKPGYGKNGGLAIDASKFNVNEVFGASQLYRKIVGY